LNSSCKLDASSSYASCLSSSRAKGGRYFNGYSVRESKIPTVQGKPTSGNLSNISSLEPVFATVVVFAETVESLLASFCRGSLPGRRLAPLESSWGSGRGDVRRPRHGLEAPGGPAMGLFPSPRSQPRDATDALAFREWKPIPRRGRNGSPVVQTHKKSARSKIREGRNNFDKSVVGGDESFSEWGRLRFFFMEEF
jgi:hypothetical protein